MTSGLASLDAFLDRVWEKSDAGDFSAAAELLDAAPPLDPSDIAARWQTTRAYAFAGRLAKARSLFAEPPDPSAGPVGGPLGTDHDILVSTSSDISSQSSVPNWLLFD